MWYYNVYTRAMYYVYRFALNVWRAIALLVLPSSINEVLYLNTGSNLSRYTCIAICVLSHRVYYGPITEYL